MPGASVETHRPHDIEGDITVFYDADIQYRLRMADLRREADHERLVRQARAAHEGKEKNGAAARSRPARRSGRRDDGRGGTEWVEAA